MTKKIIFYGRTQVGLITLLYLLAKEKIVVVIPEDEIIRRACEIFNLKTTTLNDFSNEEFDLFICCHGKTILPESKLAKGKFVNIHPCLFKYKGHDPIGRYIKNKGAQASVESHYMIKEVDEGEVIASIFFPTPIISLYEQFYMIAIPYYLQCIHRTLMRLTSYKNQKD